MRCQKCTELSIYHGFDVLSGVHSPRTRTDCLSKAPEDLNGIVQIQGEMLLLRDEQVCN